MKLIDLLNKIANGEIKKGTKLKFANDTEIVCFEGQTMTIDVDELNTEVEIIEEKQQEGRWKPKVGERYWYISGEGVFLSIWHNHPVDNRCYLSKNVFKTEQEAKNCYAYKTALLEAEKPFEYGLDNYYIYHEWDTEDTVLRFTNFEQVQGTVYLGNDFGIAEAFLDKWYKQILKYEFGIEE